MNIVTKFQILVRYIFGRCDLWKLGFLQAVEFHLKEETLGKSS